MIQWNYSITDIVSITSDKSQWLHHLFSWNTVSSNFQATSNAQNIKAKHTDNDFFSKYASKDKVNWTNKRSSGVSTIFILAILVIWAATSSTTKSVIPHFWTLYGKPSVCVSTPAKQDASNRTHRLNFQVQDGREKVRPSSFEHAQQKKKFPPPPKSA